MTALVIPKSTGAEQSFSAREFTRDVAAAKRAAANGPVFITERGKPSFALITIEEYQRLRGGAKPAKELSLWDVMQSIAIDEPVDVEFPKLNIQLKVPDFSDEA